MAAVLTLRYVGNAGVELLFGPSRVTVDAYYRGVPGAFDLPAYRPDPKGAIALFTHSHGDHLDPSGLSPPGSRAAGPFSVGRAFHGRGAAFTAFDPPSASRLVTGGAAVTAFRTVHGQEHLSYLIELGPFRIFHDGDNEDTRVLDAVTLGRIDPLLFCPWQGSGWEDFLEALRPAKIVMIHLNRREREEHRKGMFLPSISGRPPSGVEVIDPGGVMTMEEPRA